MPLTNLPSQSLAVLRERTAPLHRRLEARLAFLVDGTVTHDRYRRLLGGMLGFHGPLEGCLVAHSGALSLRGIDLSARRKANLLRCDLAALGLGPDEVAGLPGWVPPTVGSVAEILGWLYVSEGATLGGRIILAALERSLQLGPTSGASFFAGYGEVTGQRWREVTAALAELPAADVEPAAAAGAALFAAFETWLDSQLCLS